MIEIREGQDLRGIREGTLVIEHGKNGFAGLWVMPGLRGELRTIDEDEL